MATHVVDFETGSWSGQTNGHNSKAVINHAAALGWSNYGVQLNNSNIIPPPYSGTFYFIIPVAYETGITELRFYFDPNSILIAGQPDVPPYVNLSIGLLYAISFYDLPIFNLYLGGNGTDYLFIAEKATKTGAQFSQHVITDEPHCVELKITRATTESSQDGTFTLWIDEILVESVINLDNYDNYQLLQNVYAGGLGEIPPTNGYIYIDEIVLNDTGEWIGPNTPPIIPEIIIQTVNLSGNVTQAEQISGNYVQTTILQGTFHKQPIVGIFKRGNGLLGNSKNIIDLQGDV